MTQLTFGVVHILVEDVVYALPPRAAHIIAHGPGVAGTGSIIEFSQDGSNWNDGGLPFGGATPVRAIINAAFIRCTDENATITLKVYKTF